MTYLTQEVKNDIERWSSYGWEWGIIHRLLYHEYGIELPKIELITLIRKNKISFTNNEELCISMRSVSSLLTI